MKRIEVQTGDRYGRLTVLRELPKRKKKRYFLCKCDCGNLREVRFVAMRARETKSCGCLRDERNCVSNLKHNMYGTRLYGSWHCMKQRCLNPNSSAYKHYGGRGIKVCKAWMEFILFRNWALSHGFKEGLTIERIDNNGNYESSNCTWIPQSKQSHNTRRNRFITYKGKTKILKDWAREIGMHQQVLSKRLDNGWSIEKALTTPIQEKYSHAVSRSL